MSTNTQNIEMASSPRSLSPQEKQHSENKFNEYVAAQDRLSLSGGWVEEKSCVSTEAGSEVDPEDIIEFDAYEEVKEEMTVSENPAPLPASMKVDYQDDASDQIEGLEKKQVIVQATWPTANAIRASKRIVKCTNPFDTLYEEEEEDTSLPFDDQEIIQSEKDAALELTYKISRLEAENEELKEKLAFGHDEFGRNVKINELYDENHRLRSERAVKLALNPEAVKREVEASGLIEKNLPEIFVFQGSNLAAELLNRWFRRIFTLDYKKTFNNGLFLSMMESFGWYAFSFFTYVITMTVRPSFLVEFFTGIFVTIGLFGSFANFAYNVTIFFYCGMDYYTPRAKLLYARIKEWLIAPAVNIWRIRALWKRSKRFIKYSAPIVAVVVLFGIIFNRSRKSASNEDKKNQNRWRSEVNTKQEILLSLVGILGLVSYWSSDILRHAKDAIFWTRSLYLAYFGIKEYVCSNANTADCAKKELGPETCQECKFRSLESVFDRIVFRTDPKYIVHHPHEAARVLAQSMAMSSDLQWFNDLPITLQKVILSQYGLTYEDYIMGNFKILSDTNGRIWLKVCKNDWFISSANPSPKLAYRSVDYIDNIKVEHNPSSFRQETVFRNLLERDMNALDTDSSEDEAIGSRNGYLARLEQLIRGNAGRVELSEAKLIGDNLQENYSDEEGNTYYQIVDASNRWVSFKRQVSQISMFGINKIVDHYIVVGVLIAIFLVICFNLTSFKSIFERFSSKEEVEGTTPAVDEIAAIVEESESVDEFKHKFTAARDRKAIGITHDKPDKVRIKKEPTQKDRVDKFRHDNGLKLDLPNVGRPFVVYDDPAKMLRSLTNGIPIRTYKGEVVFAKTAEEFKNLMQSKGQILLDKMPPEYTKGTIQVRQDAWAEFEPFKNKIRNVLRKTGDWQVPLPMNQRMELRDALSLNYFKPDIEAHRAIQFLINGSKLESVLELKPPNDLVKKSASMKWRKSEEVNVPCPAEMIPGRPKCTVKGCTFIHEHNHKEILELRNYAEKMKISEEMHGVNVDVNECLNTLLGQTMKHQDFIPGYKSHKPIIGCLSNECNQLHKYDEKLYNQITRLVEDAKMLRDDKLEAKVDGLSESDVNGINAFGIVRLHRDEKDLMLDEQVFVIPGGYQFKEVEARVEPSDYFEIVGTACFIKHHFVSAAHVFEMCKQKLFVYDYRTQILSPIIAINQLIGRDVVIFKVASDKLMMSTHKHFSRKNPIVAKENVGEKGVTLVKVNHETFYPYTQSGKVIMRDLKNGFVTYQVPTKPGDSGCIVCDAETGCVIGIHKGVHEFGKSNKCSTFLSEHLACLNSQNPPKKSLNSVPSWN